MENKDTTISKRRKSSKSNKRIHSQRTKKTGKRKSQISQEYQDNEREVTKLLEHSHLISDISSESEDESDKFFYGSITKSVTEYPDSEIPANGTGLSYSPLHSESSAGDYGSAAAATQGTTTLAATFIQVDSEDYTDLVKFKRFKFVYKAKELLYKPSLNLCSISSMKLKNSQMMINRYKEEAKARKCQISFIVLRALQNPIDVQKFYEDKITYRTWCAVSFKPIFIEPSLKAVEVPNRRFLTIDLMHLRFTQHPQLQEEHHLANELELLCEEYQQRLREKITERLYANLQIERNVLKELLSSASERNLNSEQQQQMKEKLTRRIQHQLKTVKTLREQLYNEEGKNKQTLESVLKLWLQLRRLRENQNRQFSRLKLSIKVESLNETTTEARQKSWDERYQADLNEIYREKLEEYYRTKRRWQEEIEQQGDGLHIQSTEKPKRPNYSQLSIQVKQRFTKCFPNPQEPRLQISCNLCQREELAGLPAPRKQQSFFVRLYFDDQIVGESRTYRLEPDLCIDIKETIGVLINRRVPKNIYLKLFKKSRVGVIKKIDNLELPFATLSSSISAENQRSRLHFKSVKRKMAGYIRLQVLQHDEPGKLPKECLVKTEFLENKKQTANQQSSESKPRSVGRKPHKAYNDTPGDDDSSSSSCNEDHDDAESKNTCTFEEDLLGFADVSELYTNERWNILNSRYLRNDPCTRDLKCVPMLDHEIEFDWQQQQTEVIDFGSWMDPIDVHKHEGKKYLKNLYNAIQEQCQRLAQNQLYRKGNILLYDEPLSWSSLFYTLKLIFQPHLRSNSYSNNLRSTSNQSITKYVEQSFRIVCNIIRATGIPVRIADTTVNKDKQGNQDVATASPHTFFTQHLKYTNVRPFIALNYGDRICRTMTAEGSNPTWNEQLILQVKGSLSDLKEDVKISLYDEVIENKLHDDNSIKGTVDIFQRVQNNWLGEYRVPIRALLKEQKFEGIFEINTPKILLGYKRPALETPAFATDNNDVMLQSLPAIKETLRLWCCISIEPCFDLPIVSVNCLPTSELDEINQYLEQWSLQAKELHSSRYMDPLICTFEGKRICLSRLMHPLKPPSLQISENELNNVCRYVSLLSLLKFYDPCMNLDGIWLNNEVLLDTTWGSAKDLGVLLCNYLLHLGFKCWLVFGLSIPHGESVFVLYINSDNMELMLIDPSTGKRYSIKDVFCPLQTIRMVSTLDRFYLNIQRDDRVATMNFNFQDTACWLPAFSKRNPAPLAGFQNISYTYRQAMDIKDLQVNIERKIMKKFSTWRGLRKTLWNRAFQSHLKTLLVDLDRLFYDQAAVNAHEIESNEMIGRLFPNYKIFGFTMNFSYTNLNQISDCIKMTSLHSNASNSVEFALATHINAYANNLLSVWIFLMSAVPVD